MPVPRIDAHWRDSARVPRFFIIDARSAFPLLLFLVHIHWWSFYLAVIATVFFGVLERYGISVTVFLRLGRSFLAGKIKLTKPWWQSNSRR